MRKVAYRILGVLFLLTTLISCSRTKAIAAQETIRIACVGDSNTRGYALPNLDENCYPGQLQTKLGDRFVVENHGVGGTCVLKNGRIPYWKTLALQQALACEPDIVIFGFGGNDLLPQDRKEFISSFIPDFLSLIRQFKRLPSRPKVYVIAPIAAKGDDLTDKMNRLLYPLLKTIAILTNAGTIDLYTPIKDDRRNFIDGVHMSVDGCDIASRVVADRILADLRMTEED